MFENFPSILESAFCLACDGCCRFVAPDCQWRPKVEKGVDYGHLLDDENYIKADVYGKEFICWCFNPTDHTCQIYTKRPFECRLYPFLFVVKDNERYLGLHLSCPFVLEHRTSARFEAFIEKVRTFFSTDEARGFLERNPHLGSSYAPYLNEIEFIATLTS